MYDDERKILTDRLDKPVIHNRKKIRDKYRQDIQTMGQKQHISTAEDMKLREMLLSPQNKVEDTRNEKNGCALLLFLEIFFTIAVLIASLAVTVMPQEPSGRTMADAISTFFFIEIPLWLPFLIILKYFHEIFSYCFQRFSISKPLQISLQCLDSILHTNSSIYLWN